MKLAGFVLFVLLASAQNTEAQISPGSVLEQYWNIIKDFFTQNWELAQTTFQSLASAGEKPPSSTVEVEVEDAVDSEKAKIQEETENFARAIKQLIDNVNWNISSTELKNLESKDEYRKRRSSPTPFASKAIMQIFDNFLLNVSKLADNLRNAAGQLQLNYHEQNNAQREIR